MFNLKNLSLALMLIASLTVLGAWRANPPTSSKPINPSDEEQIEKTVQDYFETRYHAFSSLTLPDFGTLVDDSARGNTFLRSEQDKLEVELYNAEIHRLRYVKYEFSLEFEDMLVDATTQTAVIVVVEGHDVVFEVSAPKVSSMRNLRHTIEMRKGSDGWKIVSDGYDDYLWRLIRATGYSKEELLQLIDDAHNSRTDKGSGQSAGGAQDLSPLATQGLPYDRDGAVAYAHTWATAPRPYNPKYADFTDLGGDCTNFVSQAIHEGAHAPMAIGEQRG